MDDECEGCEECLAVEPMASMRFSWPALLVATFTMAASFCAAFADWWTDLANQFAMVHNRKIDKDDARDFAEEVLADVKQFPTKE